MGDQGEFVLVGAAMSARPASVGFDPPDSNGWNLSTIRLTEAKPRRVMARPHHVTRLHGPFGHLRSNSNGSHPSVTHTFANQSVVAALRPASTS